MRRWNGWGDEANHFPLKKSAKEFLATTIGEGAPLPDASFSSVEAKVPKSRIPSHSLISTQAADRVRHARGQSFPDWLAMRSGEFSVFPDGVAFPESPQEVRELLQFAKAENLELIPYGGGTSVVGHINPEKSSRAVLTIDMGRMNQLLDLDTESNIATFGAGTPGPLVESQLAAHSYTLGHYPQSWELSTIGGWVASRSSGQQSLRYGRIEQLFAGGSIETTEGTLEIPTIPASSAGPDIREIILGSEGRMGIITQVKVRVLPLAKKESFHVVFFPNWVDATTAVRKLAQTKLPLSMVRLSNETETYTQLQLAGHPMAISALSTALSLRGAGKQKCMLTFGVTGSKAACKFAYDQAIKIVKKQGGVNTGTILGKKWQENRFKSPYLRHGLWENGYAVDTLETAVDWSQTTTAMHAIESAITRALETMNEKVHVFTHLSHVYNQGSSIYTTYIFRCADSYEETFARWQKIKAAASEEIVRHGGTISHQHGVGVDHAPYLKAEKTEMGIGAIKNLCEYFDPEQRMNPGKLIREE
ncbi:MAG: FAD-binding oxidoreductase [Pseudomonadales bacterium]|nr:FAD-binding oxidoreductase [Pseudomonadales bacterium]